METPERKVTEDEANRLMRAIIDELSRAQYGRGVEDLTLQELKVITDSLKPYPPPAVPALDLDIPETTSSWTGTMRNKWTRMGEPIGHRDTIIDGIYEAIRARYVGFNPDAKDKVVAATWLKQIIDEYRLPTIDQDIRHELKNMFEAEGIKVIEK